MKWSFLTTHYNKRSALPESIPSILDNLPDNRELIIVDGGSDDGSIQWLREYDDPRIRLDVYKSNRGEGRARALELASGEYVFQQIDTDIKYGDWFEDYWQQFRRLENELDYPFLSTYDSIHISRKDDARKIEWPPLARIEERVYIDRALEKLDFRLLNERRSVEIKTSDNTNWFERLKKWYVSSRDYNRTGFDITDLLKYNHNEFAPTKALLADLVSIAGGVSAIPMTSYDKNRNSWQEIPTWETAIPDQLIIDA